MMTSNWIPLVFVIVKMRPTPIAPSPRIVKIKMRIAMVKDWLKMFTIALLRYKRTEITSSKTIIDELAIVVEMEVIFGME